MEKRNFSTNKPINKTGKEVEWMIHKVLGNKPNKERGKNKIIYRPVRNFLGADAMMDNISITICRVNNNLTTIKLENSGDVERNLSGNWRIPMIRKSYNILENALEYMYNKN